MKEYVIDVIEITPEGEEVHHQHQVRVQTDETGIMKILQDAIVDGEIEDNQLAE